MPFSECNNYQVSNNLQSSLLYLINFVNFKVPNFNGSFHKEGLAVILRKQAVRECHNTTILLRQLPHAVLPAFFSSRLTPGKFLCGTRIFLSGSQNYVWRRSRLPIKGTPYAHLSPLRPRAPTAKPLFLGSSVPSNLIERKGERSIVATIDFFFFSFSFSFRVG